MDKEKIGFAGTLDNLLDDLNNIRLAVVLEGAKKRGCVKATYKLEEQFENESLLTKIFDIDKYHTERLKLDGVGVYT